MKTYPVSHTEIKYLTRLGVKPKELLKVKAFPIKEVRPPKQGEWFLSGAIVEAYYAPNDLSISYQIAHIAVTEPVTTYQIERWL